MMSSESSPAPPSSSSSSASSQLPSSSSTSSQPLTLKASEAIFIQQNPLAQQIVLEHQPSTDPLGEQTHYAIRHQIEEEDEADSLPNFSEEPPAPSIHEQEEQEQEQPQLQLKQLVARKGSRPRRESTLSEENINSVLVWKNLTVTTKARGSSDVKVLLNNVSGAMTGGMWAVMGPSGCGKSTLLNTLACRLDVNTTVVGEMRLNGRPYHNAELKKMSGYVMQDDLLNGSLTVRETLYYTAALRLPRTFTSQERAERVEEVIREMGLTHCQDVIVGDPQQKGISGGERRRLCIGMELLMRPTLLFLDEPTSGLDSVTAVSLVELLHRISRSGKCSMMMSIHQPQARLFALFDRLLLLKSGRILYQGSIPGALQLFEDCGFPVPHYSNPADHILDVITPPMDSSLTDYFEHEGIARVAEADTLMPPIAEDNTTAVAGALNDVENSAKLRAKFEDNAEAFDLGYGSSKPVLLERDQVSWWRQFTVLVQRNFQDASRRKLPIIFAAIQSTVMAILFGFAFFDIGTGQSSVTRRNPASFFFCVNQGVVGGLTIINAFPAERALMLRERAAGTYFVSAYFCAKILVDTLMSLPVPICFGVISYWIIGFQPLAGKFFVFLVILILCNLSATSVALMISALCKTTDVATTVLPMFLEICRLFGGFYLAPINLPNYFSWLDALSYIKYSYVGIALNEFSGLILECDNSTGTCTPSGAASIKALGLDYITTEGCIGVLIGYIVFCQTVAFLAIRFLKSK